MNVLELFERGGFVMWLILGCSVVGGMLFFERILVLRDDRVVPVKKVRTWLEDVARGRADAVLAQTESESSSMAVIFSAVLRARHQSIFVMKEAAEDAGRQEAGKLERFVGAIGTVASISPLLGLLGTVTGMIGVFQKVAETGVGDPLQMAAGIWEALLTTAFGLMVGIPAVVVHRFLTSRIDTYVLALEGEAVRLVEILDHAATSTLRPLTTRASLDGSLGADGTPPVDESSRP